jgi:coenzyme F420 hydrogenase subunit beta
VKGFLINTARAAGGLPLRRMPGFMRSIMGWVMPRVGPRGLEFARARVEMKAVETVLHLRRQERQRMKTMIPDHVWRLVAPYGLMAEDGERAIPAPNSGTERAVASTGSIPGA